MQESEQDPLHGNKWGGRWRWIAAIAFLFVLAIAVLGIVIYRAEPTLRAMVIETLSTRFKSKVELDAFHVSLFKGLQVSGAGLRIFGETDPNNYEPGFQPIINIARIRVSHGNSGSFSFSYSCRHRLYKGIAAEFAAQRASQ